MKHFAHHLDYRGGLVSAPAWVGWIKDAYRGWNAAYSHNDRENVKQYLLWRFGLDVPTCVLPMGEQPVTTTLMSKQHGIPIQDRD